jgi:hypothetical protein
MPITGAIMKDIQLTREDLPNAKKKFQAFTLIELPFASSLR